MKLNRVYFLLLIAFLWNCSNKEDNEVVKFNPNTPHQEEVVDTIVINETKSISWSAVDDLNQNALIDIQLENNEELKIDNLPLFAKNLLPRMYKLNKGQFIWNSEKNIEDAYRAFELSYLDGLLISDYHQAKLDSLKSEILNATIKEQKEALFAKHDIVLTDAMLMYCFHLLIGKTDPADIDNNWNYKSRTISQRAIVSFFKSLKDEKLLEGLDELRPTKLDYRAMMNAIRYYKLIEDDTWTNIEGFDKLELGDTNQYIPIIRDRLSLCCQWDELAADSTIFDSLLYIGIINFQNTHGLDTDGIIGKGTVELLNLNPKQRIEKLKANLERLRWLHDDVSDYSVEVNIAAFKLYVRKQNELIYECKVMTGQPYHKTPIFTAPMKYIDFNPTWTVPYSIASRELLPKLKKEGASYLARNNMEILSRLGKGLDPDEVNFAELSSNNFPYILRQKPGPGNALGEVKFMFPNQYSVYLHDTQSKTLFSRSSRAFSHGCIRVENPLQLAEVLLDDRKKWDRDKIDKVIEGRKTKTVNLKSNVDVLLLYYTAGLFPDGTMFYIPDVYKRDIAILEILNAPFSYDGSTVNRVYQDRKPTNLDSLMNL